MLRFLSLLGATILYVFVSVLLYASGSTHQQSWCWCFHHWLSEPLTTAANSLLSFLWLTLDAPCVSYTLLDREASCEMHPF
jgi:hypothetical protein